MEAAQPVLADWMRATGALYPAGNVRNLKALGWLYWASQRFVNGRLERFA
jgi:hypothetical protein